MNIPPLSIHVNGIDASRGDYLTAELTAAEVAAAARGEMGVGEASRDDREMLAQRHRRDREKPLGPIAGIRANDLASAGWGVIFAGDLDAAVVEALQPLIDFRGKQAEDRFQRFAGPEGYRVDDPTESVRSFLRRRKVLPSMPADPQRVPYYLLLVGSPAAVPFRFQYGLDVVYAVGRLWFENPDGTPDLDAFDRYARAVVASESEPDEKGRRRQAVFVGVANEDDVATGLSLRDLVQPLGNAIGATEEIRKAGWDVQTCGPEKAQEAGPRRIPQRARAPCLSLHGEPRAGFPERAPAPVGAPGGVAVPGLARAAGVARGDPSRTLSRGRRHRRQRRLAGMVAFHFACFGAGTPALDDFAHLARFGSAQALASRPFVARLPQRLLRQGALAVIGHVERAWACSFHGGDGVGRQLQVFQSIVQSLLGGHRIGWALEYLGTLYAALATELTGEIQREAQGQRPDDGLLADLWTAHNDARGFVVLGDPAVKLGGSVAGITPTPAREAERGDW